MNDEICRTCRFWAESKLDSGFGTCRAHPPVHLPAIVYLRVRTADEQHEAEHGERMDEDDYNAYAASEVRQTWAWKQPTTDEGDWCGEWQAKRPDE